MELNIQKGAGPIKDKTIRAKFNSLSLEEINVAGDRLLIPDFLDSYDDWIKSSKLNSLKMKDGMSMYMTFAVTHTIAEFVLQHHKRRIRYFKGEYPGTTRLASGHKLDVAFLDNEDVRDGDAVIMSAPFSATGDIHPRFYEILKQATDLNVPVMVDCAFWGICSDIHLDLTYPCIKTVAFSVSKCYWMGAYRLGMVYSDDVPFGIYVLNDHQYVSRVAGIIAMNLFREFGPDYLPEKYAAKQKAVCEQLGNMGPSKTVIFGIGNEAWPKFVREGGYNRISFHQFLGE